MDTLRWVYIEFEQLRGLCPHAGALRCWVNAAFPDNPILNQHDPDQGKPIFQYPLIQYKIIEGLPILFGVEDGADELMRLFAAIREGDIRLGPLVIRGLTLKEGRVVLRETETQRYVFLTPWLAFNRKNLARFREEADWAKRKALLKGILVGNVLAMAKTVGIMIDFQIQIRTKVDLLKVEIPRHDLVAHGFVGTFEANVELPPLIGLGNHVSLGFGTVVKEDTSGRYY
ncbi:MAG: CRISPR-associated endonuclease Cas6 [Candidatus Hadarchaeaceae archaeon]